MALQLGALRDALLEAGATPESARKASEEAAGYEGRLFGLERDLTVLRWMVGGLYAIALPGAWLLVRIAFKLGALS
jgi:hypothetical protein